MDIKSLLTKMTRYNKTFFKVIKKITINKCNYLTENIFFLLHVNVAFSIYQQFFNGYLSIITSFMYKTLILKYQAIFSF